MIEKKLEDVIKDVAYIDDQWLIYSLCNILNKDWKDIDALWNSICSLVCDDKINPYLKDISDIFDTFPEEEYGKIMSKEYLKEILKELKPIILYSAYYLGADYIYRNSGNIDVFNTAYLKRIFGDKIPPDIASKEDDFTTIYDRIRKSVPSYISHLREYYSPNYINPYAINKQKERHGLVTGRDDFNLFLGNIILFLHKIYNINDTDLKYGKHTISNSVKWNKLNNVLLTVTLLLFETMPDLPAHKNTDHGNWTCERIIDMDAKTELYKNYCRLGIDSSIEKTITEYAIEDLFHLDRISFALEQYYTFIDKLNNSDMLNGSKDKQYIEELDSIYLKICSMLVFMPSVGVSKLFSEDIENLLKVYTIESEKNMTSVMGPLFRIFTLNGVIFPSVAALFARAWYLNADNSILSPEHVKERVWELEKYIGDLNCPGILSENKKAWNTDRFVELIRKKNRKGNSKKFKTPASPYAQHLSFEASTGILLNQFSWWNYRNIIVRNKMVLPKEMRNLYEDTDDGKKKAQFPISRISAKGTILALAGGLIDEIG